MKLLSLIVPVLNEEEAVPLFYEAVQEVLRDEPYELEILFVDDGSTDKTLEIIEGLHVRDSRVRASPFRATSARNWHWPQDCRRPEGMLWCPWTWICRIRRPC